MTTKQLLAEINEVRRAQSLIEQLGDDPLVIAAKLEELGIRGRKSAGECCPLANYLRRQGFPSLMVGNTEIYLDEVVNCELPDAAEEFVELFDDGNFPQLEAEEHEAA